jgi:hypothetical protein
MSRRSAKKESTKNGTCTYMNQILCLLFMNGIWTKYVPLFGGYLILLVTTMSGILKKIRNKTWVVAVISATSKEPEVF